MAATICPWHATRNTRDFKPLPVGSPRASLHFSKLHATSASPVRKMGWYVVHLFSGGLVWDVHVDSWVFATRFGELRPCSVFESAQSAQVDWKGFEKFSVSVTGTGCRGFGSIATRHSFLMTHVSRFFEQSNVVVHVSNHGQYGRRWGPTTGFYLWQHQPARHVVFEPQMSWEKRNVLANTLVSSVSHVYLGKVLRSTVARNRPNCLNIPLAHALLSQFFFGSMAHRTPAVTWLALF